MASNVSKLSVAGAIILAGVILSSAFDGYTAMALKASNQETAVNKFLEWKQEYVKLKPTEELWLKAVAKYSNKLDVKSLYTNLNNDAIDADSLMAAKPVEFNGLQGQIKSLKVCVTNKSSQGLDIHKSDFSSIFKNVKDSLSRPDIVANSVYFSIVNSEPKATLSNMCVILRSDGPDETSPNIPSATLSEKAN